MGRVCIASSGKSKIFLNEYKAAATQATFPVFSQIERLEFAGGGAPKRPAGF